MDTWTWQSGSDYLVHYGTPMHSGRYPWGSGDRPHQRLEKAKRATKKAVDAGVSAYKKVKKRQIDQIISRANYKEIRRNIRRFNDDDLKRALNRAEDMKRLKTALREANKNDSISSKEFGRDLVKDILKSVGTMVIVPTVTGYLGYKVKEHFARGESDSRQPNFYDEVTKNINNKKKEK